MVIIWRLFICLSILVLYSSLGYFIEKNFSGAIVFAQYISPPTPDPGCSPGIASPTTISPSGTITPGTYNINWSGAVYAVSYRVELDKDYGSTPFYSSPCNNTFNNGDYCGYTSSGSWNNVTFEAGKTYRIGVGAVNNCNQEDSPRSVVVNVINNTPPPTPSPGPQPPVATISVSPSAITGASNVTINWSTSNIPAGHTCSNNWNVAMPINPNTAGSDVKNMNGSWNFTISCTNGTTASAQLNFTPQAPTWTNAFGGCSTDGLGDSFAYLSWTSVAGASGYELIRYGLPYPPAMAGGNVHQDWTVADTGGNYLYYVRSYTNTGVVSPWNSISVNVPVCAKPLPFTLSSTISTCNGNNPRMSYNWGVSTYANQYYTWRYRAAPAPIPPGTPPYDATWVSLPPAPLPPNIFNFIDNGIELAQVPVGTYVHYFVRAVNSLSGAYREAFAQPAFTRDCAPPAPVLIINGNTVPLIPPPNANSGQPVVLSWSSTHATTCAQVSSIFGTNPSYDPNWNGGSVGPAGGPVNTRRIFNPPSNTATFALSCTNANLEPSIQTVTVQQILNIVQPQNPPFIQTTGGDVHTQGKITAPSPTP